MRRHHPPHCLPASPPRGLSGWHSRKDRGTSPPERLLGIPVPVTTSSQTLCFPIGVSILSFIKFSFGGLTVHMGNARRHSLQLFKPHTPSRWHPEGTAALTAPSANVTTCTRKARSCLCSVSQASAPTARTEEDAKNMCRLPGVQSLSFPGLPHWTLIPPAPSPHLRLHLLLSGDSRATRRAGPRALLVEVLRQSVSEPVGQRCLSPGSTSPLSLTKV